MNNIHLCYDFQGWPCSIMNLKEILLDLGFEEKDGKISISSDNAILKAYPCLMEDDGMAYGINPKYVTCVDKNIYDTKIKGLETDIDEETKSYVTYKTENQINIFNLFIDGEASDEYLEQMTETKETD